MTETSDKLTAVSLRKRANKTQRQVAEELGKKVGTISDWERGKTKPQLSFSEVKKLMDFLGCTLDELIQAFENSHCHEAE